MRIDEKNYETNIFSSSSNKRDELVAWHCGLERKLCRYWASFGFYIYNISYPHRTNNHTAVRVSVRVYIYCII